VRSASELVTPTGSEEELEETQELAEAAR